MEKEKSKGLHDKHRERMRNRFRENGFKGFADHEVLEYILFFAIPRGNTNETAHRLLNYFGSFSNVLLASEDELVKVEGIGPAAARLITMLMEAIRYYQRSNTKLPPKNFSIDTIADTLRPKFYGSATESMYALFMDNGGNIIKLKEVAQGSVNEVTFSLRSFVREAVRMNTSQVVLAHNHPNGLALPSREDINLTNRLSMMLDCVGIVLQDHLIFDGEGEMTSIRQRGCR